MCVMCVHKAGRRGRPSRRKSIEKAQRGEVEEHMPDSVCRSVICSALAQCSTREEGCEEQGGEVGALGLIIQGLECQMKECRFHEVTPLLC